MSSAPPWLKYQKAESGPWEKYAAAKEQSELGVEVGKSVLGNRPDQTGMQNWLEVAGEMYTGESESLPQQFAGAATAAGMTLPGIALPALAGSAGALGAIGRLASDARVTAPIAFGYELMRTGDLKKAGVAAAAGGGLSLGLKQVGKQLAKRALSLKQAEEAMRAAESAKEEATRAAARAQQAAARVTSTPIPSAPAAATSTRTMPGEVIAFPRNPTEAGAAMRVPASAPAAATAPAPITATVPKTIAQETPDRAGLMRFAREIAASNPKVGEKIWILLDDAGRPVKMLTSDQAGAAKRAGMATTWIRNLWSK